jgi:hypothetical protein
MIYSVKRPKKGPWIVKPKEATSDALRKRLVKGKK